MAAVNEVVVQRVTEIDGLGRGARTRGGRGDVGEKFVVIGRQAQLMELGRWEEANTGGDG